MIKDLGETTILLGFESEMQETLVALIIIKRTGMGITTTGML